MPHRAVTLNGWHKKWLVLPLLLPAQARQPRSEAEHARGQGQWEKDRAPLLPHAGSPCRNLVWHLTLHTPQRITYAQTARQTSLNFRFYIFLLN